MNLYFRYIFFCLLSIPIWVFASQPTVSREIIVDPKSPMPMDGGLKGGEIALTFDDGPNPITTRKILKILEKYRVKATFFQIGHFAKSHPQVTKEILAQGHSLGSHSFGKKHPDLASLPIDEAIASMRDGHEAVEAAGGANFHTPFFRFPRFSSNEDLRRAAENFGFVTFYANIITEDWQTPDPKVLLSKSLAAVESQKKGIVLFHDIQPQTAEMLDTFLAEILSRGYKTVVFRPKETLATLGQKKVFV